MDCSSPGSSVHGILQTRLLEWGINHNLVLFFQFKRTMGHYFLLLFFFLNLVCGKYCSGHWEDDNEQGLVLTFKMLVGLTLK